MSKPISDVHATIVNDSQRIGREDILLLELNRARHALQYLKNKFSKDEMLNLLKSDLHTTTEKVQEWRRQSNGDWSASAVILDVPYLTAEQFHKYFKTMVDHKDTKGLQVAHPEHFVSMPFNGNWVDVVENVGEDDLPWNIRLEIVSPETTLPAAWDESFDFDKRLGCNIFDVEGVLIGYVLHEFKDDAKKGCLSIKLTMVLPAASPERLQRGHLNHFMIEFLNWVTNARASL